MGRLVSGLIIGILLVPLGIMVWFHWGNPPVAVADHPLPFEKQITSVPLHARIDREMVKTPPLEPTDDNLVAGAQIYSDNCAFCHGQKGKNSDFGAHMFPGAPQLWRKHPRGDVVGVSDDPPGETYWKVSNGIRLTGMPAFDKILSDQQMWQVTLLLANANKQLPPAADVMVSPAPPAAPAPPAPAKKK
ncbi:MAG TPA: cytochrome c [Terracidiphilus sp.]|nr:cytochrome c [Terracidiphilus sp.]